MPRLFTPINLRLTDFAGVDKALARMSWLGYGRSYPCKCAAPRFRCLLAAIFFVVSRAGQL